MGAIGLGREIVNGRSRDPSPPAITTAFISSDPLNSPPGA